MSLYTITVTERSSGQYTATITDETGTVVPLASIATVQLTLYNEADGLIINNRDAQSIMNENDGTIDDTSGQLTWHWQPADTPIIDTVGEPPKEAHRACFDVVFVGGGRATHEIRMIVDNLSKIA